jgi:hypothetical protein
MRKRLLMSVMLLLTAALVACASGGLPQNAHPEGWQQRNVGTRTVWVKPDAPGETYEYLSKPFDGDTKAYASDMTLDFVLKRHAKLLKTVAFQPCPGEAGLQTYAAGKNTILVAYAVYNGKALEAIYTRPAGTPEDPAALTAMGKSVCTAGI